MRPHAGGSANHARCAPPASPPARGTHRPRRRNQPWPPSAPPTRGAGAVPPSARSSSAAAMPHASSASQRALAARAAPHARSSSGSAGAT
eukprot:scaffold116979_cov33-Phaeocystis_antarctica.AAC.1